MGYQYITPKGKAVAWTLAILWCLAMWRYGMSE